MTNSEKQPKWQETTVQELFELTDEEMEFIELKIELAKRLRDLR